MATETEVKFIVPRLEPRKILVLPWLERLMTGPAQTQTLITTYFDTPGRAFAKHRIAVRIRRKGALRIQGVKSPSRNGGVEKNEWEQNTQRDKPDFRQIPDKDFRERLKKLSAPGLDPVFQTRVVRTSVPLRLGASTVELALDRGAIQAGRRRAAIHEVELELKQGRTSDLLKLSRHLARTIHGTYGFQAKAERGYALLANAKDAPEFAGKPAVTAAMSPEAALRSIGFSCLHQVDGNRLAVGSGDPEGLHQMRVGLRRLRVALNIFHKKARFASRIDREAKWLIAKLTRARDLDVFLRDCLLPRTKDKLDDGSLNMLKDLVRKRRDKEFLKLKSLVAGKRYRDFLLAAALGLAGVEGKKGASSSEAVGHNKSANLTAVANARLRHFVHLIRRKLAAFDRLDEDGRHKLRITVKKLRYAAEFFEGLYPHEKQARQLKRLRKLLKKLQDDLGTLHDMAVHQELMRALLPARQGAIVKAITRSDKTREKKLLRNVKKAGTAFARAAHFWTR